MARTPKSQVRDNLEFLKRDIREMKLILERYIHDGVIKECLNPSSVDNKLYAFIGIRKLKLLKIYEMNEDFRGPVKLTDDKDRLFDRSVIEYCVEILDLKKYIHCEGEFDKLNFIYGLFGELSEKKPEESEKVLRRFFPLLDEISYQLAKCNDREQFMEEYRRRNE